MSEIKERTKRKLEASGRITPREVLEAYRETGLLPTDRGWWRETKEGRSACAVGALMVSAGTVDLDEFEVDELDADPSTLWSPEADGLICDYFEQRGFERPEIASSYQFEFTQGFDGRQIFSADMIGLRGAIARRDGARCRQFVFGKQ